MKFSPTSVSDFEEADVLPIGMPEFTIDRTSAELTIDLLESLARLKDLDCLLREASRVLPQFPNSLKLVVWAAYRINQPEFAGRIESYLRENGYADRDIPLSSDSESSRNCKALEAAIKNRNTALAWALASLPYTAINIPTIELAAKQRMLDLLYYIGSKNIMILQEEIKPKKLSIFEAVRRVLNKRWNQNVTWDMIFDKVTTFCKEPEILIVLSWGIPIKHKTLSLVSNTHDDLAISLITNCRSKLEVDETQLIVEASKLGFLVKLAKALRPLKPKFLYSSGVVSKLALHMTSPSTMLYAIYLIKKIPKKIFTDENLAQIARTLRSMLTLHEDNRLVQHWNPLLVCVACSELCKKLESYNFEFKHDFEVMQEKFKEIGVSFTSLFSEFRKVYLIYTDQSYPGGTLLDLTTARTTEYRFLLQSNLVASVVEQLWAGTPQKLMMHLASPLTHLYSNKSPQKVFQIHKSKKMSQDMICIFSYSAWKLSAEMRFWLETIFLIMVLIRVIVTIQVFTSSLLIVDNWAKSPLDRLSAANSITDQKPVLWECFAFFSTVILRLVTGLIFQILNGGKVSFFSYRIFIDISLFVLMFAIVLRVEFNHDDTDTLEYLFAMMMFAICAKICIIMLITKVYGPVVRAIAIIFIKSFRLGSLFLLSTFAFSLVFYVLFYRQDPSFENIWTSFQTLFNFAAGNLDFTVFGIRANLGATLEIIWIFVSMVTLLNIIVAFITNRYSSMEPQANADYASLLYTSYYELRYNDLYSFLVIFPAPSNAICLCLMPLYFVLSDKRKFNHILMAISYIQMFVVAVCLFTIYNIVIFPLAYVKTAFHLAKMGRYGRAYRKKLMTWMVVGLAYEVYLMAISYKYLMKVLLNGVAKPLSYELSKEMLQHTLKITQSLSKGRKVPVILPLAEVMEALSKSDIPNHNFLKSLGLVKSQASLNSNIIKDYNLCSQVEFIEQFSWVKNKKQEHLINVSLLTNFIQQHFNENYRLIPVHISGIQRSLLKIQKRV